MCGNVTIISLILHKIDEVPTIKISILGKRISGVLNIQFISNLYIFNVIIKDSTSNDRISSNGSAIASKSGYLMFYYMFQFILYNITDFCYIDIDGCEGITTEKMELLL
ncbi:hypothetical protein ACTFIZ_006821 [Dictyostelium cf. discoideum]